MARIVQKIHFPGSFVTIGVMICVQQSLFFAHAHPLKYFFLIMNNTNGTCGEKINLIFFVIDFIIDLVLWGQPVQL